MTDESRQQHRRNLRTESFSFQRSDTALFESWTEDRALPLPAGAPEDAEPETKQVQHYKLIPRRVRRAMARSAGNRRFRADRGLPELTSMLRRGGVRK